MKRILKGLMSFIILISMIVLALYFLNQKSFPEKYEDVFDSFFKNWKMNEIVIDDVSIPKKYISRTQKVDYGTDLNKETYIEDKKGLFLTLQNIYIQQNITNIILQVLICMKRIQFLNYLRKRRYLYIFVYNGQIIDDAYTIMSQYHDNKDDYQSYKCGTILYNYNKFIQEKFS